MALQVWLPLNGDLRNQGLSDVTVTNNGVIFDNNGKIGKCAYFNGSSWIKITLPVNMTTLKNTSIAAWIKSTSSILALGGISHDAGTGQAACTLYSSGWQFPNGTTYKYVAGGQANITNKSTWNHVVCTIDNININTYLNGILITTVTIESLSALTNLSSTNFLEIGCDHPGGNEFLTGYINDFRIYDHALSLREVKELAKGLILHYPLNNNGIGNLNILSDFDTSFQSYNNGTTTLFTNQMNNGTQEIVSNIGGINGKCLHLHSSGGNNRQYRTKNLEQGKTYTISADYYSLNAQSTAWRGELNGGNYSWVGNNAAYTTPGKWQRLSYTYTNLTSNAVIYFFVYCAQGQDCYVKNIKIEEGESSTPWCPYFLDSNIIEYDCSGFGNNGIRNGIIEYISDTPRYRTCSNITNNSSYIKIDNLQTSGFSNSYSFSWWGKISSFSGRMFWGFSNGIRLNGVYNGNLWNTGDSSNNPLYVPGTTTQIAVPSVNTWHHFVMTGDGTNCKLYLDGEYYGIAKTYKSISGTTIYINGWDNGTSYSGQIYISDFRIYCTTLSADDIKALYEDSASIDKNGNFHAYEYIEDDNIINVNINKQGIFTVPEEIMENSLKEPSIDDENIYAKGEFYED